MSDEFAYARDRAAKAFLEVMRARRPDLAWEVTVGPLEGHDGVGLGAGPREVDGLVAGGDHADARIHRKPAATDPHHAEKAA